MHFINIMIKNAHKIETLERQEEYVGPSQNWYKKADALYEAALIINPKAVKEGGHNHLEMLVHLRDQLKVAKKHSRAN